MTGGVKRSVRVAERVRGELMTMFLRGEVRDPRALGLVITRLTVTDDLQLARVYVRSAVGEDASDAERKRTVEALTQAKGFLRRELGRRVKLKYTPNLRFYWDDEIDEAERMEALLSEVRSDAEADQ